MYKQSALFLNKNESEPAKIREKRQNFITIRGHKCDHRGTSRTAIENREAQAASLCDLRRKHCLSRQAEGKMRFTIP